MAKFTDVTGNGVLYITQNYHGESASNPSDLSKQCAIDIKMNGGEFFHSACDGTVELTTSSYSGYISVIPTGANYRILYVHTDRWLVKKGDKVKAGQKLGYIKNMTGSHLHFGLKNISGKAPHPKPMDYFDRKLNFKTTYADIAKDWFVNGKLNWKLFKDLQCEPITTTPPVTPPEAPEITALKKQVKTLEAQIEKLQAQLSELQAQLKTQEASNKVLTEEIGKKSETLIALQNKYDGLSVIKNELENKITKLEKTITDSNFLESYTAGELFGELWKRLTTRPEKEE